MPYIAELVDAGCSVHLHNWGCKIDLEGEILYRGWREGPGSRLWRIKLTDDETQRIQPDADLEDYNAISGTICMGVGYNQNKQHFIKYYHVVLGSHPKLTLVAAAKKSYLKGLPGLTAEAINTYVGVEDTTEMGHMREVPSGTCLTTKQTNRGRPALDILERDATTEDAMAILQQEPYNAKTMMVFVTVVLANI